jgi:hypothetical protein
MLHALKTEVDFFQQIALGDKTCEVRKADRPFEVGDEIVLQEWNPEGKYYSGNEWRGNITHILKDERFCKKGFCVLSIKQKTKEVVEGEDNG